MGCPKEGASSTSSRRVTACWVGASLALVVGLSGWTWYGRPLAADRPKLSGDDRVEAVRRKLAAVSEGVADLGIPENSTIPRRLFGFGIARVNDRFVELPTCLIDVDQAAGQLSQAAATVRTAVRVCRIQNTQEQKMLCASVILDILQFVGFGAEFLEGSAQQCADHLVPGDLCAETVTELVAALAQVAQAATGITFSCINLTRNELIRRHPNLLVSNDGLGLPGLDRDRDRRLVAEAADFPEVEDAAAFEVASPERMLANLSVGEELEQIAAMAALNQTRHEQRIFNHFKCFLNAEEAAAFVARAGDVISAAVLDCSKVNKNTPEGEEACELDVVGTIESFTFAANSIARAIFRCPTIVSLSAQCAANIINVISSTEALVNSISGLNLCIKEDEDAFVEHETHLLPAPMYRPPPPPEAYRRDEGVLPISGPDRAPPPEPVLAAMPHGRQQHPQSPGPLPDSSETFAEPEAQAGEFLGQEP